MAIAGDIVIKLAADFAGLIKLLIEALHDPAKAHPLTTFRWFLDHCASEIDGRLNLPTQH